MADLTEYKPKQATETWLEFLKRQGPEVVNGVAMALAGLRAPPSPVMSPRVQGFHGSPGELVGEPKTPFWMARGENHASHYMPLEKTPDGGWARTGTMNEFSVDPSSYLRVKEGGLIDRMSEGDRRPTLFKWADRAGYRGVLFDADNEMVALDPRSIQRVVPPPK